MRESLEVEKLVALYTANLIGIHLITNSEPRDTLHIANLIGIRLVTNSEPLEKNIKSHTKFIPNQIPIKPKLVEDFRYPSTSNNATSATALFPG